MPHHPVLPDRPSISRESRESRESRPLRATPMVWSTWCLLNYGRKAGRPSWNIGHKTIISHFASFRDLFKVRSVICYNAYRLRRLGKLPKLSFLAFLTLKDISGKDCQFAAVVIVCFPADQSKMMETHRETSYKLMQREVLHIDDFTVFLWHHSSYVLFPGYSHPEAKFSAPPLYCSISNMCTC